MPTYYIGGTSEIQSGKTKGVQPGAQTAQNQATNSASQRFSNPDLVDLLSNRVGGVVDGASQYFNDYLQNPAQSPIFQNTLQTLLNNLQPGEAAQRQNTQDQFRQAGALNSGAFANAVVNDNRNIGAQRASTATDLLGKTFGSTLQGLLGGIGQANPLISALKLSESQGQSTGSSASQAFKPQAGGGGMTGTITQQGNPWAFQSNGNPGGSGYRGTLSTPNPTFTAPTQVTPVLDNYNFDSGSGSADNWY